MPELPDVETYKRYLDDRALHQRITHVDVTSSRLLAGASPRELGHALVRHRLEETQRHGKHLFARIGNGRWLMLHFGMTGSLSYYEGDADPPQYTRVLIDFERGHHLAYVEPRKLGRIALADSPRGFVEAHRLGPDALALDFASFRELASRSRGAIKSWLMDQHAIAGIGNVYADEILLQAGIHPRRNPNALDQREIKRLFQHLGKVLKKAIAVHADPARMPKSFLLPHRRRGAQCPHCGARIETIALGGRTTYYCPKCQR
jgi:formamidopyrimidine-DNA glycosylase